MYVSFPPGEGNFQVFYVDTYPLLLKVKRIICWTIGENNTHINSRTDYSKWDKSIYPELVKR